MLTKLSSQVGPKLHASPECNLVHGRLYLIETIIWMLEKVHLVLLAPFGMSLPG